MSTPVYPETSLPVSPTIDQIMSALALIETRKIVGDSSSPTIPVRNARMWDATVEQAANWVHDQFKHPVDFSLPEKLGPAKTSELTSLIVQLLRIATAMKVDLNITIPALINAMGTTTDRDIVI